MEHVSQLNHRLSKQQFAYIFTALLLCIVTVGSLATGAAPIEFSELTFWFSQSPIDSFSNTVLFDIRLPRIILSIFVGAGLAASGAAMQALFRNPLADPGLIGVAGGGALGAVLVIVLGNTLFSGFTSYAGMYALPIGAMLGCLSVCSLIYQFSNRGGQLTIVTLLLAGIAINAIVGSIIGVLTLISNDSELRQLTFWTMGNLGGNNWALELPVLVLISISLIGFKRLAKPLNLYLLGEAQAQHLGVPVKTMKKQVFLFTALAVGSAVSISGMIGFVGFVIPHIVRTLIGPDHRYLLPVSMLLGASLLTIADTLARMIIIPAELPIGLVTSALGGPFFLLVLYKQANKSISI